MELVYYKGPFPDEDGRLSAPRRPPLTAPIIGCLFTDAIEGVPWINPLRYGKRACSNEEIRDLIQSSNSSRGICFTCSLIDDIVKKRGLIMGVGDKNSNVQLSWVALNWIRIFAADRNSTIERASTTLAAFLPTALTPNLISQIMHTRSFAVDVGHPYETELIRIASYIGGRLI